MTKLTNAELYKIGIAVGNFANCNIDAGVHCVLPVVDLRTGRKINQVFVPLEKWFNVLADMNAKAEAYIGACQLFMQDHKCAVDDTFVDLFREVYEQR
jgi:hypothetical protein